MNDGKGGGCLKGLAIGCGSCFLLVVILVVGVWAGWGTLREIGPFKRLHGFVETAKSEAVEMNELRKRLVEKYPARAVNVNASVNSVNGVTTKTLLVSFSGPGFALPEGAEAKERLAREIAGTIAASYETLDRYDRLRLSIAEEGSGASLGSVSEFEFPVAELLTRR